MKKKNMAVLWVVCFLALLIIPRAVWTVTKDNYETVVTENTVVTEIPKLTKDNWKSYGQSLEDYYNSNVPFRSQLIQANSLLNVNVLKERFINEKVVIGDDNWLFYCEETNIEDYKGTNLYTEEELAAMAQNLLNVRQQLADKNCEFVIFLAPNKETIYSEYLPSYIQDMKKGELTPRFENMIFATMAVTGVISGIARGSNQTALGHKFYETTRILFPEAARPYLHGEIVGIGLLLQNHVNGEEANNAFLLDLMKKYGMPSRITDVGITPTEETKQTYLAHLLKTSSMENATAKDVERLQNSLAYLWQL